MLRTMNSAQFERVVDDRPLHVTEITCPIHIALYTSLGIVMLDLFARPVLPGMDDVRILGCPTLGVLGLDVYAGLTECARRQVERWAKPVENVTCIAYQRVILSVGAT